MVPQQTDVPVGNRSDYAVSRDFCRIFAEDLNGLYTLSFLLTAEPSRAEKCFVQALEDCLVAARVFKDWARAWARRAVIQNAVRLLQPALEPRPVSVTALDAETAVAADPSVRLSAIFQLKTFERFVFVMSVLERCSDHEITVLLGCSRRDVIRARSRAMERIAKVAEKGRAAVAFGAGALLGNTGLAAKTA